MYGFAPIIRAGGREHVVTAHAETGALFLAEKLPLGGWRVNVFLVGGAGSAYWQKEVLAYFVRPDGSLDRRDGMWFGLLVPNLSSLPSRGFTTENIIGAVSGAVYPFLLATSILHCKNVTAQRVAVPEALKRAAAKRGRPIYSHSILNISPARKILKSEGELSKGASLSKALHVCRGHFKDYRDGAGLFGKAKGIYWWEQALRGNVSAGVHVKNYRVKP
jgi:hypothetical protein